MKKEKWIRSFLATDTMAPELVELVVLATGLRWENVETMRLGVTRIKKTADGYRLDIRIGKRRF